MVVQTRWSRQIYVVPFVIDAEEERDLIRTTENDEWVEVGDIDTQKRRARE